MRKRYRLVIEPRLKGGPAMTDREKESCEGDVFGEGGSRKGLSAPGLMPCIRASAGH
jgi:hypothetical protein